MLPAHRHYAADNDSLGRYVALVPCGLEHLVQERLRSELNEYTVLLEVLGDSAQDSAQSAVKQASKKNTSHPCCRSPVHGGLSLSGSTHHHRHPVSVGYDRDTAVACLPGHLHGTTWLRLHTNAPPSHVYQLRCVNVVLLLVECFESVQLHPQQSLQEAVRSLQEAIKKHPMYRQQFDKALHLWRIHVQENWNSNSPPTDKKPLSYRLSFVRTDSKLYSYSRTEFLSSDIVEHLAPMEETWRVDLTNYNLEIVFCQKGNDLLVGLSMRPYAALGARAFDRGDLASDVTAPFIHCPTTDVVRLRPSTAHLLLQLADLQPGEMVFDPCSGIGTIPVEAAIMNQSLVGIGGDLVLANSTFETIAVDYLVQARKLVHHGACEQMAWDAANLPWRPNTVDAIVSDLPFGQQCMSASKLQKFLPLVISEMARVLCKGSGRAVVLCGSYAPVVDALQQTQHDNVWKLPCSSIFPVNIGGHIAWVIVVHRGSGNHTILQNHAELVRKLTLIRVRSERLDRQDNNGKRKRAQA